MASIGLVPSKGTRTSLLDAFGSGAVSFHLWHKSFLLLGGLELLFLGSEENHGDGIAFLGGVFFDFGIFSENYLHAVDDLEANFHMRSFASTERYRNFNLVTFIKKFTNVVTFGLQVAFVGFRANFNFFQLDDLLFLLGFLGFFRQLILILTEVHKSAYWRIRCRRYFYQVVAPFFSHLNCIAGGNDADHVTLFIYQANLGNPYPSVDTNVTFDTLTSRKIKNGAAGSYSMN